MLKYVIYSKLQWWAKVLGQLCNIRNNSNFRMLLNSVFFTKYFAVRPPPHHPMQCWKSGQIMETKDHKSSFDTANKSDSVATENQPTLTLWNLRSKLLFSFVIPIHFRQKQWGEVDKISSKFILCDHVRNSHDHSVLQSIDFTRRNLMLITLRAWRVKGAV